MAHISEPDFKFAGSVVVQRSFVMMALTQKRSCGKWFAMDGHNCMFSYKCIQINNGIVFMQMDPGLGLILGKSDAKPMFITEWNTNNVPAIISYGEKLRKPGVSEIISSMNSLGKCVYPVCELV